MEENSNVSDKQRIVQTDIDAKDGQTKCPKCGATDISLNAKKGLLRCNYCRHEFDAEKVASLVTDITQLNGEIVGSGTQDIAASVENFITLQCTSCGAEVVIDTEEATHARCHWCRNVLSLNKQIPNGSIPDVVLPFKLTKNEAKEKIEEFVNKRKFFSHPKFKEEFTTDNIMGVYFPYMVVDVNSHAAFNGKGEHLARTYTRGSDDNERRYYDADVYEIDREFDLIINGLTVESSIDKLDRKSSNKTNNIINSIMPFDIENCVKWDSNYLRGYTSEKRDINIDQLRPLVDVQSKDIARFSANKTLGYYDRGVKWSKEELTVKGKQWKSAYLPVWLYSYQQVKGNEKILHYIAVNARTKETMGSVPIHTPKLLLVTFIIEIIALIMMLFIDMDGYEVILLVAGLIFFFAMKLKYRNFNARHHHEVETKTQMFNISKKDRFIRQDKGLSNSKMIGANNTRVLSEKMAEKIYETITNT